MSGSKKCLLKTGKNVTGSSSINNFGIIAKKFGSRLLIECWWAHFNFSTPRFLHFLMFRSHDFFFLPIHFFLSTLPSIMICNSKICPMLDVFHNLMIVNSFLLRPMHLNTSSLMILSTVSLKGVCKATSQITCAFKVQVSTPYNRYWQHINFILMWRFIFIFINIEVGKTGDRLYNFCLRIFGKFGRSLTATN